MYSWLSRAFALGDAANEMAGNPKKGFRTRSVGGHTTYVILWLVSQTKPEYAVRGTQKEVKRNTKFLFTTQN